MADAKSALIALGGSTESGASGLPNIPAVPSSDDSALTNILASMKLWMEKAAGEGFTGFASKADLIAAGVLQSDPSGAVKPVAMNMAVPPVPTGLLASGAMTTILVTWDSPMSAYGNHGYTEVWAAETDNFSSAVLVGQGAGFIFSHAVGEDSTRYYWVRFVSTSGIKGPFNSVNGTLGQTSKNVSYVLSTLTGALTTSQLSAALNSRIDLIDGPSTLPNSVAAKLQEEANTRAQAILNEASARSSGDAALQTQINTLSAASTGDLTNLMTALQQEQTARINGDTAEATARETLASQMRGSYTGTDVNQVVTGLLYSERTARSSADAAEASAREALASTVSNNYSTLNAAISTEASTRATQDTAISNTVTALSSTVSNNYNTLSSAISSEASTRATQDTAISDSVTALSATVTNNYNTLSSSITSEQSARSSADSALGTRIDTVQARLNTGGDVANAIVQSQTTANTAVTNAATAQSTADAKVKTFYQSTTPTASAVGDLWVNTADNNHIYRWSGSLWADAADARIAATASQVTTLQTTVNGNTASIQTQATSINGLQGQYTVKVDNNGYVAGYGLASTLTNATPYAEFTIVADKFSIAPVATNASAADGSPFFHLTVPTVIDGVTVPAGTYMKSAFIHDAAITNAQIHDLAADKITTGTLAAGRIATNSITADKINGTNLAVVNGTFSGSLQAATGTFTGALSAATGTFSGRLTAGVLDPGAFAGQTYAYGTPGSYTITVPSGTGWSAINMRFTLQGAGGGGGGGAGSANSRATCSGGGGGAGSSVTITLANVTPGSSYTLTVGAGGYGAPVSTIGQTGGAGGNTSLAGYVAYGGQPGTGGNPYNLTAGAGGSIGGGAGITSGDMPGYMPWRPGGSGGSSAFGGGGGSDAAGGIGAGGGGGSAGEGDVDRGGAPGGHGYAIVEFFDPNSVVTNVRYSNLITWLDTVGHGAVPANAR